MTKQRKPRAAKPRDLSFGAVQRNLAAKQAAAAAPSPRAKKKTAALQIEKLIDKRRNPKNHRLRHAALLAAERPQQTRTQPHACG